VHLIRPRSNVTREVTSTADVRHRESWDGAVDAKVIPNPYRVRVKPKPSEVLALCELEDAHNEWKRARWTGDRREMSKALARLRHAQSRFASTDFGPRAQEAIRGSTNRR